MTEYELREKFQAVFDQLDRIEGKLATKLSLVPAAPSSSGREVASDSDLDGKYGNEEIRKDPSGKYWNGDSFKGKRMSECSAEYLEAFAKYKDACAYMNEKSGDEAKAKYIGYDRKSAARARGWAKRVSDGFKPASDSLFDKSADDSDVPF